jgi:hypothetical protein
MYRDKLLGNDQLKDAFLADVREDVFKGSRQWKVQKKLNEEFVWVGAEFVGEDLPADGKVPLLNFTSSMANSSTKVCSWMSRTPGKKPFCSRDSKELLKATVVSLNAMEIEHHLYKVERRCRSLLWFPSWPME